MNGAISGNLWNEVGLLPDDARALSLHQGTMFVIDEFDKHVPDTLEKSDQVSQGVRRRIAFLPARHYRRRVGICDRANPQHSLAWIMGGTDGDRGDGDKRRRIAPHDYSVCSREPSTLG
jgi:hypothetical protein